MTTTQSRSIAAGIVAVAVIGGMIYISHPTKDNTTAVSESSSSTSGSVASSSSLAQEETGATTTQVSHPNIMVDNVSPLQVISSPLTITGKARGWYFEGSFPVELIDGNGKALVAGPAQAQSDWMTADFVPFKITLTFAKPATATGTLIFRNDNPSGLPEKSQEYRIPVRFSAAEKRVSLYYYNPTKDKDAQGNVLCSSQGLVPVQRALPVTSTPIQDTLRTLLGGELTASEKAAGITTEFPLPGVTLTGVSLSQNGTLTIALTDPQNKTSGGSCRVQVLRAEIEATAKQFSAVKSVVFSPLTLFQP